MFLRAGRLSSTPLVSLVPTVRSRLTHTMSENSIPYTLPLPGGIPDTHRPHTERTTTILVPKENTAFLNPVQEYNRDLSVATIRAWNNLRKEELEGRWRQKLEREAKKKAAKKGGEAPVDCAEPAAEIAESAEAKAENGAEGEAGPSTEVCPAPRLLRIADKTQRKFRAPKFTILEALSATGLRSIRYAKEIPDVRTVLANDISPSACDAMRRNVALNGVGEPSQPTPSEAAPTGVTDEEMAENAPDLGRREGCTGHVKVNEGDACALMYSRRGLRDRVEVVDLDPYGTAAPFIDAAINALGDGGLLAVTCTDLAVLAGSNYPEKCFSNYGGTVVNAEYSHEVALRLVLNSIAQAAARYGKYIHPLISLSIDFYVRLFIRVDTRPAEVKRLASQTGVVYACGFCQTPVLQPFGREVQKESKKGNATTQYRVATGPTAAGKCEECGSTQALGGPMWLGPIQDREFIARLIGEIEADKEHYGTYPRMHGMLTLAGEELDAPFYFSANKVHGFAHSSAMPTKNYISALLNAGYKVSRSHALSGSVKTDAPRSFVYDIIREHVKEHPVRLDKISEMSPTHKLLAKPMSHTVDFTPHPDAKKFEKDKDSKAVFYQVNPLPNWGPGSRAKSVKAAKEEGDKGEKRKSEDAPEGEAKRAKVDEDEEAAMNQ